MKLYINRYAFLTVLFKVVSMAWLVAFFGLYADNAIASQEKPMVIIIPSYNNRQWCQVNIHSVLFQHYTNFRIIFIDDCSSDDTFGVVQQEVINKGAMNKVTLIRNQTRKGALANIYSAVHSCADNEIILLLDGDDCFPSNVVLQRVNLAYQNPNTWLTYGQYKVFPDNRIGENKEISQGVIAKNIFREWDWVTTHLRTFYAGLFKRVKLEDLLYEGQFFDVTWDMAFMFPMLEECGGKFTFIPDVLYTYNCATASNDFKTKLVRQLHCDKVIRARKKYQPLQQPPWFSLPESNDASLIVFSHHPDFLESFLQGLQQHVTHVNDVMVLYAAQEHTKMAYTELQKKYSAFSYRGYDAHSCKIEILSALARAANNYIIMAHDDVMFKNSIDGAQCARALEATGAYGFYCVLGKNITESLALERGLANPTLLQLKDDLYAWQFVHGEQEWRTPHSLAMAMYRRTDLIRVLKDLAFESPAALAAAWDKIQFDFNAVGLCYAESKAVMVDHQFGQTQASGVDLKSVQLAAVNSAIKLRKK